MKRPFLTKISPNTLRNAVPHALTPKRGRLYGQSRPRLRCERRRGRGPIERLNYGINSISVGEMYQHWGSPFHRTQGRPIPMFFWIVTCWPSSKMWHRLLATAASSSLSAPALTFLIMRE
jgi:hypothetical protein